jgi:hypothetical protein
MSTPWPQECPIDEPGGGDANDGSIKFSLEEMAAIIEDLMRIADELNRSGDEVNAYLLDLVTNRLLDRSFGSDGGLGPR